LGWPRRIAAPGGRAIISDHCSDARAATPGSAARALAPVAATLASGMLKIDVFPHILPHPFFDRLMHVAPRGGLMVKRVQNIPVMIDLDKRFEIMDRHEGYVQVLTLSSPPLEIIAGADITPDLAKMANDEMAVLVERYPERFPGFVASLPMNNPDAAMREIDRA